MISRGGGISWVPRKLERLLSVGLLFVGVLSLLLLIGVFELLSGVLELFSGSSSMDLYRMSNLGGSVLFILEDFANCLCCFCEKYNLFLAGFFINIRINYLDWFHLR